MYTKFKERQTNEGTHSTFWHTHNWEDYPPKPEGWGGLNYYTDQIRCSSCGMITKKKPYEVSDTYAGAMMGSG